MLFSLRSSFLRTRFGRHMLLLFLACAILPLAAFTAIVLTGTSSEMERQTSDHLRRTAKAIGMAIIAKVAEARDAGDHIARLARTTTGSALEAAERDAAIAEMRAVLVLSETGDTLVAVRKHKFAQLTQRIPASGPVGLAFVHSQGRGHVAVLHSEHEVDRKPIQVLALFDVESFFGAPEIVNWHDSGLQSCVMLAGEAIWCSLPVESWGEVRASSESVELRRELYAAATWAGFAPVTGPRTPLKVVAFAETPAALGANPTFRSSLILIVAISILLVFLASHVELRRSLRPLEDLTQATRRVGARNLAVKVDVLRNDEFGVLARSFNDMSARIASHVALLSSTAAVNDEALRATSLNGLLPRLTAHVRDLVPSHYGLSLAVRSKQTLWLRRSVMPGSAQWVDDEVELGAAALSGLQQGNMASGRFGTPDSRAYLRAPSSQTGWHCSAVAIPLNAERELVGILTVLVPVGTLATNSELENVHAISRDLALALNRTRLMQRLEQFNYGTLTALARAVDAKSPWTAGHSECVTHGALQLGAQLQLSSDDMDILHRGGLLHDIGKIAVPGEILDKPERLTSDEMKIVQSHPEVGARILAPIEAYAPMMPIVLYHHERFDGTGYPRGLHGNAIPFLARVVAVVDVYDALVSDRPYRAGWHPDRALELIQQSAGTHFDPDIAAALVAVEPALRQWYAARHEQDAERRGPRDIESLIAI